ncbi:MAG: hypothetical protein LPK45_06760, partial [Bacteroidota bacterium]|nr:hypothetical protein [Bacteroidota bacterium]MDX5430774.1 hypothetical protein [Bacteroidota bacterium]MDX5469519.1 hypothetical protein [Bacteroidota bacterium]
LISACEKAPLEKPDPFKIDQGIAVEFAMGEQFFGELKQMVDLAYEGRLSNPQGGMGFSNCAQVERDTLLKKIIIDFGEQGCKGKDGRNRRGKLEVNYLGGGYHDSGTLVIIRTNQYSVNQYALQGILYVTHLGKDKNGAPSWRIQEKGSLYFPDGTLGFDWDAYRELCFAKGWDTHKMPEDDIWANTIQGEMMSSRHSGWKYESKSRIERSPLCPHPQSGLVLLDRPGIEEHAVNYGNGLCDPEAELSGGGTSLRFSLK